VSRHATPCCDRVHDDSPRYTDPFRHTDTGHPRRCRRRVRLKPRLRHPFPRIESCGEAFRGSGRRVHTPAPRMLRSLHPVHWFTLRRRALRRAHDGRRRSTRVGYPIPRPCPIPLRRLKTSGPGIRRPAPVPRPREPQPNEHRPASAVRRGTHRRLARQLEAQAAGPEQAEPRAQLPHDPGLHRRHRRRAAGRGLPPPVPAREADALPRRRRGPGAASDIGIDGIRARVIDGSAACIRIAHRRIDGRHASRADDHRERAESGRRGYVGGGIVISRCWNCGSRDDGGGWGWIDGHRGIVIRRRGRCLGGSGRGGCGSWGCLRWIDRGRCGIVDGDGWISICR